MRLKITTTPRETLLWCPSVEEAAQLRAVLREEQMTVLPANRSELDFFDVIPPEGDFDPEKIINVEIGVDAGTSLELLHRAGHTLVRHEWQPGHSDKIWGVQLDD